MRFMLSTKATVIAIALVVLGALGVAFIPDECVEPRPGIAYIPLENWHQALYLCILYDKWLEPPVWDFIELIVKRFREKKKGNEKA